jgi:stress response protein YsnF
VTASETDGKPLLLAEEELSVSRQRVTTGRVRVHLRTETEQRQVEAELRSESVEVERVPLDRELPPGVAPPGPREEEGGAVLVVEKRLVLREELRIRRHGTTERVRQPVTLRRQHAEVERLPPEHPVRDESKDKEPYA